MKTYHCCPANVPELSTSIAMSGRDYIYTIRDMNREYLPETRRETLHGGSTPASMRVMVSGRYSQSMPLTDNGTAVKTTLKITALFLLSLIGSSAALAGGIYQQSADFINEVFDNKPPKAEVLWLNKDLKKQITEILDHKYKGLRVRYWQQKQKSAWVLDEIGKEKSITTGIVINNSKIELVKILAFRESRGWEVRHDFFTDQFKQAKLKDSHQLDKTIDNISGATLSVRAVRKLAQIALLLEQKIQQKSSQ